MVNRQVEKALYLVGVQVNVPNMPGSVPRTSTYALTAATLPYIRQIAGKGLRRACTEDSGIARGINVARGTVTYPAVADALGIAWRPWNEVL